MKKVLLAFLILFYVGTSSGIVLHFHYCMGVLAKWTLTSPDEGHCALCGMTKTATKKNSCCKDEVKQAKVDHFKKVSQFVYGFKQVPVVLQRQLKSTVNAIALSSLKINTFYNNAPPETQRVRSYIKNCTYRI